MSVENIPGRPGFSPPPSGAMDDIRAKVERERRELLAKERRENGEIPPQEEELPASWAGDVVKAKDVATRVLGMKIVAVQYDQSNGSIIAIDLQTPDGHKVTLAFNPTDDARFLPGVIDTAEEPKSKAL